MFAYLLRTTVTMSIATGATLLLIAGSSAPVSAATPDTARRSAVIDTTAFDLARPAGRAALVAQLRSTARRLCNTGNTEQLAAALAMRACVDAATAAAMPKLDALAAERLHAESAATLSPTVGK